MTLSVDRCRIARDPLNMPSKASVTLQILFVWFVSAILSVPRGLSSEYAPKSRGTLKCRKTPFLNLRTAQACFASLNLLIIYIVPAGILINELRKTRRQMQYLAACQIEQGKSFARRLRLMRNACIFTCIFVTLWLPLGILQFPFDWMQPERISNEAVVMLRDAFGSLVLIQACINPLLLLLLSFDFQELVTSCVVQL
ncbi:unnamed protein product [Allacma fusca]|uniref:G-protein coupled receptors family 1 profile domain-containing protein n=1 Tax=Allacma fusca TaxID=39272 RepID=A0A8J2LFL7_9HEXA|nr:unnamed protein product [Allacma fusca]